MEMKTAISCTIFFFNDTATTEIYTLSLHDALPIYPFGVAPSQVVVHRDDMHAPPGERVQRRRKRRDQRFPFARLHLRDFAFVQDDAANELHVEVPHVEEAAPRLARKRKGGNDHRLERLLYAL